MRPDIDWHRWHIRLMAWAAWSGNDFPAPLARPGKPELRIAVDEPDAQRVDALLAGLGRDTLPVYATRQYYRRRWWDDSVPGYRLLADYLEQTAFRKPWRQDWRRIVQYEPGQTVREQREAAARRLLDRGTLLLDASEKGLARAG